MHLSVTEGLGVVVALVVLAITFGSALAAGIPLVTALIGVVVGLAGLAASTAVTSVNSSSPTLALMIGLAVGIDYALFVVSRHRTNLAESEVGVAESVARSLATAGSAVVFAGATVVIALLGLSVAQIPFLTVMGAAAAATVAVAVVVALTVLPAVLSLFGERLRPKPSRRQRQRSRGGERWAGLVTRRPWVTTVLVVAVLGLVAIPAKDMDLALPDNGISEEGSGARVTYDLVAEGFGAGYNAPLLVTADIIATTDPLGVMQDIGAEIEDLPGVEAVVLSTPNEKADTGLVQVIPTAGARDDATADLVAELRSVAPDLEDEYGISDVRVTGATALQIDVSDRLGAALLPFGLVVMGLSLLLLMVVFRSIAVPVKATLGFLLSVLAAFGTIGAVYGWGWGADLLNATTGPVISFLPIILMGVLFGLAMDYEVFLVSRMREDFVHTGDAKASVRTGFASSARVVTAAAVIMIAVFAAFIPSGDTIIQPIALGLAVGVFVDAFLVRMTLVPAVMTLLGHRAWWLPRWLDRLLPSLDVEGEALAHHLRHEEWVERHGPAAVRAAGLTVLDEQGRARGRGRAPHGRARHRARGGRGRPGRPPHAAGDPGRTRPSRRRRPRRPRPGAAGRDRRRPGPHRVPARRRPLAAGGARRRRARRHGTARGRGRPHGRARLRPGRSRRRGGPAAARTHGGQPSAGLTHHPDRGGGAVTRRTLVAVAAALLVPAVAGAVALASFDDRADQVDQVRAAVVNLDEAVTITDPETGRGPAGAGRTAARRRADGRRRRAARLGAHRRRRRRDRARGRHLPGGHHDPGELLRRRDLGAGRRPAAGDHRGADRGGGSPLAAVVGQQVAAAAAGAVGDQLTTQYLDQVLLGFGSVASQLGAAADGADELAGGLDQLATGAGTAASGADDLASGAGDLASGVDGIADGADDLASGADRLTGGVRSLASRPPRPRGRHRVAPAGHPGARGRCGTGVVRPRGPAAAVRRRRQPGRAGRVRRHRPDRPRRRRPRHRHRPARRRCTADRLGHRGRRRRRAAARPRCVRPGLGRVAAGRRRRLGSVRGRRPRLRRR